MIPSPVSMRARRGGDSSLFTPGAALSDKDAKATARRGRRCFGVGCSTTATVAVTVLVVCAVLVALQFASQPGSTATRVAPPARRGAHRDASVHRSVVIDAGSSGTRVFAFEFSDGDMSHISQLHSLRLKPGLSACYSGNGAQGAGKASVAPASPSASSSGDLPATAADQTAFTCAYNQTTQLLQSLLQADVGFEAGRVAAVPVYVRATAGLRLLSAVQRATLLRAAEKAVGDARFAPPEYELQRPRVATGTEEAVYDWLAVNVATMGLGAVRAALRHHPAESAAEEADGGDASGGAPPLLGVLDLGGASTQIVYTSVAGGDSATAVVAVGGGGDGGGGSGGADGCEHQQFLRGLGKLHLYAVSRLGYGHNEMFAATRRAWAAQYPTAAAGGGGGPAAAEAGTANPCLFRSVGTAGEAGSGNFAQCRAFVAARLADEQAAAVTPCLREPAPSGVQFVGMDHFVKIAKLLFASSSSSASSVATGEGGDGGGGRVAAAGELQVAAAVTVAPAVIQPALTDFAARGAELCALDFAEVQRRNVAVPGGPALAAKDLRSACFLSAYSHVLLVDVYGFAPDSRRVRFSDRVGPVAANWALGAAVFEFLSKEPI